MKQGMTTEESLLGQLREGKVQWVSGEALGEALGVSRAAISKHIANLRRKGYEIEASTKKGYRLVESSTRLLPLEIRRGLATKRMGCGKIEYYDTIDSTNVRAQQLADQGIEEGALVVAEEQTLGKGRRGRTWHSPKGLGLYVSLVLRPGISPQEAPKLNLVASLAVARALERASAVEARLKWPNDVEIGGKKVAGILTSMVADMESVHNVVVGVGVNINGREMDFAEEIRQRGTSLRIRTGKEHDRLGVMRAFLEEFEALYDEFLEGGFSDILESWIKKSEMWGRQIRVELMDGAVEGRVKAVDSDGYLLVETKEGRLRRIVSGDVEMVAEGV